jgi:hypothetical protein
VSDVILAAATAIANEWRVLAAAWHLAVAALAVVLWWRRVDGRAIAALLALMPVSVATMAAWSSNPFNITIFVALGLVMLALAGTNVSAELRLAGARDVAAGAIMCTFGWVYPHFLDGPAWQYLYAAPLGLLPCPTLAFLMGVSLLTDSFGSKTWAILLGSMGMLYGLMGVFVLHVTVDWFLIAGAAVLLTREKRHYEISFIRFGPRPGV